MSYSSVTLSEVAIINPPISQTLSQDDEIAFIPMAAVNADLIEVQPSEMRLVRDVRNGFTCFSDGDVLVAKITPCFENGKIALARLGQQHGFGSTEFHVVRARVGKLDPRFLVHYLRQDRLRIEGERKMTGSAGQRRVPKHFLENLPISLPPFVEQRRIAAILDVADTLRTKRRAALAKLDTLAQSIFIEMFGDLVANPKGWNDELTLGDVSEIVSGITKGRRLNGQSVREVPYLAVVNVQDRALNLNFVKTIEATEEEIERYRLQKNDLLLTEGGDPDKLGRGTLWDEELPECIHQNHIFRVRLVSENINPLFLNWLVGSQRGKKYFLRAAKQTTGIASINMTQLRGFPLLIPPLSLQDEFARRIVVLGDRRASMQRSGAQSDNLFASLQHRAFRGEL
jgi:type I restriction enzyme, S subunit